MSDRKKEKEELMEKVFGKNKYSISSKDLDDMNKATSKFSNDLDELLKKSNETNDKYNELIDAANNIVLNNNKIIEARNVDAEKLRKQLIEDFGDDITKDNNLIISLNQEDLYNSFIEIENKLNEKIICQKDYLKNLCKAFRRPLVMGKQESGIDCAILVVGKTNTGRHSSIELISKLLKEKQIISNDHLTYIDMNKYQGKEDENNFVIDLYSGISNSNIIVFDNVENTSASYMSYVEEILLNGKLSLNKRYVLNNGQLVETSNALSKNTIDELSFKSKSLIYITSIKSSKLLNVLGSRFVNAIGDIVETSDLEKEEIKEVFNNKTGEFKNKVSDNLNIELKFADEFVQYVIDKYDGSNCKYINDLFSNIYDGLSEYKLNNPSNDRVDILIEAKDEITFNGNKLSDYLPKNIDNAIEEVRKELDNIIGLTEIKDYIFSLQDFYAAQKIKEASGMEVSEISKHMIFTGNPGTGKTTIARLLAKYLKAIGVLSNGQLIEVTRNDLVGKYAGHTAPLTMQVISSAIGGILFIDEAYSLYRGDNDSFGLECIDTLVKAMEDNRQDLIVILAGYTKEMKDFLSSNSGLQSRFPVQIEFPDYTGEELYEIAKINAKSAGYYIEDNAKDALIEYFSKAQANDSVRSGNGRLSRNIVEKAIMRQSSRVMKDNGKLDELLLEDFVLE